MMKDILFSYFITWEIDYDGFVVCGNGELLFSIFDNPKKRGKYQSVGLLSK